MDAMAALEEKFDAERPRIPLQEAAPEPAVKRTGATGPSLFEAFQSAAAAPTKHTQPQRAQPQPQQAQLHPRQAQPRQAQPRQAQPTPQQAERQVQQQSRAQEKRLPDDPPPEQPALDPLARLLARQNKQVMVSVPRNPVPHMEAPPGALQYDYDDATNRKRQRVSERKGTERQRRPAAAAAESQPEGEAAARSRHSSPTTQG
jgi:hypothetical protein